MGRLRQRSLLPLCLALAFGLALALPAGAQAEGGEVEEFTFAFERSAEGWTTGFADLPADAPQDLYELDGGYRPLPEGLEGAGIYLQGHNRSDDLFMFLKHQVGGLRPNTVYAVSMSIDLATRIPPGLIGIGGSPGESVYVKAGASTVEPVTVEDDLGHLRLNIDKGNQSKGGEAMLVLGDIAHPDASGDSFAIKTLTSAGQPLVVETDGQGRVWLIVGTDSGFEGKTTLYYTRISYEFGVLQPPDTGSGLSTWSDGHPGVAWIVVVMVCGVLGALRLRQLFAGRCTWKAR